MTITAVATSSEYTDEMRARDLKTFDDSKSGVKGLVDSGVTEIPKIFRHPNLVAGLSASTAAIPVIDLHGFDRERIVDQVRDASERWGFFQVINHGIPEQVIEEMMDGVRRFFEQDDEVKRKYYTRDLNNKVVYNSNFDLYTASAANWRDTFFCYMAPDPPNPQELPQACSAILLDYAYRVTKLGVSLFQILSEALGLKSDHLHETGCADGLVVICHYYPACPEPHRTLGTSKHSDNDFLTVLLQDKIGGLQVLDTKDQVWVDVPPVPGALVVNVGDLLQLLTNDKFLSVDHCVRANKMGPRISVASFFSTSFQQSSKLFGPIPELLSEHNPARYRETTVSDYLNYFKENGLDGTSPLRHFRV